MAKITITRFPDAPLQYETRTIAEFSRLLEQLILQLNTTYVQDTQDISEAQAWFFSR
jgi:hypothetical protein